MDCVANCFTDILKKQYEYWCYCGCDGISVRVSRRWGEGPYKGEYSSILYNAQEVNLWHLGFVSSGKSFDEDAIWREYTRYTFGINAST